MKIPEFTAYASLYRTSNNYHLPAFDHASPERTVLAQRGGKGFKGFEGCKMDCADKNPNWTREQCRRSCTDPGHAGESSDSSVNDFFSNIGIDFWEGACSSLLHPYLCAKVGEEIRRQS